MILEIRGRRLPGLVWHDPPCRNVHVGLQVGRVAGEFVPADAQAAAWTVDVRVIARADALDFRGPAVQGKLGERFVYLTWGELGPGGTYAMFRRAKLMLNDLVPLLAGAEDPGPIVATVDLTDERGGPRCARLRAPAVTFARGDSANI